MRLPRSAIATLAIASLLASCGPEGVPHTEHDEVVEKLRRNEMELKEVRKKIQRMEDEALEVSPEVKMYRREVLDLKNKAKARDAEFEALQKEFEAYKENYKVSIRDRELNYEIAKIETPTMVYEDVVVKNADAAGIRISYAGGTGRIRFEELDDELRERFGYDPAASAELLSQEATKKEENKRLMAERIAAARKARVSVITKPDGRKEVNIGAAKAELVKLQKFVVSSQAKLDRLQDRMEKDNFQSTSSSQYKEVNRLRDLISKAQTRMSDLERLIRANS